MTTIQATEQEKTSHATQVAHTTEETEITKRTPNTSPSKLTEMELTTTQLDSSTKIHEKIFSTLLDDVSSARNVRPETETSPTEQDSTNEDTTTKIPEATQTGRRKQLESSIIPY